MRLMAYRTPYGLTLGAVATSILSVRQGVRLQSRMHRYLLNTTCWLRWVSMDLLLAYEDSGHSLYLPGTERTGASILQPLASESK